MRSCEEAIPTPLWCLRRITRQGRDRIGTIDVDGKFLARAASEHQALFIDCCTPRQAASLLCRAAPRVHCGIVWVVTTNDTCYAAVREAAEHCLSTGAWQTSHLIYDAHPGFTEPGAWDEAEYRLLLTSAGSLRDRSKKNPRRRQAALKVFVPLIAVIDPTLWLCNTTKGWEPAWVIRDLAGRLCLRQSEVALAIFTEREAVSIPSSLLRATYGVSGLMYVDGSSVGRGHAEKG